MREWVRLGETETKGTERQKDWETKRRLGNIDHGKSGNNFYFRLIRSALS